MTIVLLEPHPLIRAGLQQLIQRMALQGNVLAPESMDLSVITQVTLDVELLILAVPADWTRAQELTARARQSVQPKRILLLCPPENAWSASGMDIDDVFCCLPNDASPLTLEGAIRMGVGRDPWGARRTRDDVTLPTRAWQCRDGEGLPGGAGISTQRSAALAQSHCVRQLACSVPVPHEQAGGAEPIEADAREHEMALLELTPRQYEVLVRLGRGEAIKTIAREIGIAPATARAHATAIYQRLGVRNKGEAVYAARCRGAQLEA